MLKASRNLNNVQKPLPMALFIMVPAFVLAPPIRARCDSNSPAKPTASQPPATDTAVNIVHKQERLADVQSAVAAFETALKGQDYQRANQIVTNILANDGQNKVPFLSRVLLNVELGNHRTHVISAIADARCAQAVPILVRLLDDPQKGVRTWAVSALGTIGDKMAIAPLQERLELERDPGAPSRQAGSLAGDHIRVALGKLGQPYARYFICGLYDTDEKRRGRAIGALASIGGHRVVPSLYRMLYAKDSQLSRDAAIAIRKLTGIQERVILTVTHKPDGGTKTTGRLRPIAEIQRDVREWMVQHRTELLRPIEPSPERWSYSAPPPLYADIVLRLRKGMTAEQVLAILGPVYHFGEAGVWQYPPDASGRSITLVFAFASGKFVLDRWLLTDFPENTQNVVKQLKSLDRSSLYLQELVWTFATTRSLVEPRPVLSLHSSPDTLTKTSQSASIIGLKRAHKVIDALADEGFFERATSNTHANLPAAGYLIKAGPYYAPIGPSMSMVRLLKRLRKALNQAAPREINELLDYLGRQYGLVETPAATHDSL